MQSYSSKIISKLELNHNAAINQTQTECSSSSDQWPRDCRLRRWGYRARLYLRGLAVSYLEQTV